MGLVPARGHRRIAGVALALALALVMGAIAGVSAAPAQEPAFSWTPQVAPAGPVLIVIGLEEQRAVVYRNGVRIGSSPVSTGKAGHETPTGVFNILQKRREHYSNLYNNAPMPFMQRLTWDGIALHAGHLPGYPASHGCVRLPYDFSEALFGITERGMTVVVAQQLESPSVATRTPFGSGAPADDGGALDGWSWQPDLSPSGPVTMVLSTADQALVVMRGGMEIGRGPVRVDDAGMGTQAYAVLEGTAAESSRLAPGQPALNWMQIPVRLDNAPERTGEDIRTAVAAGRVHIDPAFAAQVHAVLAPGSTLLVTPESIADVSTEGFTILEAAVPSTDAPDSQESEEKQR